MFWIKPKYKPKHIFVTIIKEKTAKFTRPKSPNTLGKFPSNKNGGKYDSTISSTLLFFYLFFSGLVEDIHGF